MSKPFQIGTPPSTSPRRASPTYQQPNANAPVPGLKVPPGFEQCQAPLGSEPLPNLPVNNGAKPFALR